VGRHKNATLSFQTWYRTEKGSDYGLVESSDDGVHWRQLARFTGSSDGWHDKALKLPATARYIQFRYQTNAKINGRGWYVDRVEVKSGDQTIRPDFSTSGWTKRDH
jgi:hypothetical protein